MLKKIAKKIKTRATPNEQTFFLWGTKGKKTSFWGPREKKVPLGAKKNGSFYFLWSPKGSFFHLVPQRKFFFRFGTQKEKKLLKGWRTGAIFFNFFGNFFQHVKKLINFWNFVKIKVAKFKLNQTG